MAATRSLADRHDVVEQRRVRWLELMRDTVRNDYHVPLADAAALADLDFFPANFVRSDGLRLHGRPAGVISSCLQLFSIG